MDGGSEEEVKDIQGCEGPLAVTLGYAGEPSRTRGYNGMKGAPHHLLAERPSTRMGAGTTHPLFLKLRAPVDL